MEYVVHILEPLPYTVYTVTQPALGWLKVSYDVDKQEC
jgi:hypothetical protein